MIVFVDVLGLTIIIPLLPFYAEKFGATPAMVGILAAIYAFCQFLAGPVLGKLSDRHGRRPVLLISQVGTFIGYMILAVASSIWMLFLGRIIDGITAGNLTVAQAAISDVTPPKDRVKAYGIIGVSFGLGFILGPVISGLLVGWGIQAPIYAAAGLSFLSVLGTYFLLPKAPQIIDTEVERGLFVSRNTWIRFLGHENLGVYLSQFFLFSLLFACFTTGFALFAERRFQWDGHPFAVKEVSVALACMGFYGIFLQGGLVGRLSRAWGEVKLVRWGFVTSLIGFTILIFARDLVVLGLAMVIFSFGTGVLRPALTALISQSVEATEQGIVMGVSQSLGSIAQILGPLVAGTLIGMGYLELWCLFMAAVAMLALILMVMRRHGQKQQVKV